MDSNTKSSLAMAALLAGFYNDGPYGAPFGTRRHRERQAPAITKAPADKKAKRKVTQRSQRRNRAR